MIFFNIWVPNCVEKDPLFSILLITTFNPPFRSFKYSKIKRKITNNLKLINYFIENWGCNSKIGNAQVLGVFMLYKSAPNKFGNTLPFSGTLVSSF